jgi:hypothetical protein
MASKPYNGFPAAFRERQGGAVYKAFREGRIQRPTECIICGITSADGATIQAHNEDYYEPFDYVGICFCCHMAIHKRFSNLTQWRRWRASATSGWKPPRTRDYRIFIKVFEALRDTDNTPDYTNWSYLLPDREPDLYTERANQSGLFSL